MQKGQQKDSFSCFQYLQRQIDQLRQRIESLELAYPSIDDQTDKLDWLEKERKIQSRQMDRMQQEIEKLRKIIRMR